MFGEKLIFRSNVKLYWVYKTWALRANQIRRIEASVMWIFLDWLRLTHV